MLVFRWVCGVDSAPKSLPDVGLFPGSDLSSSWPSTVLGYPGISSPAEAAWSPSCGLLGAAFSKGGDPFLVDEPLLVFSRGV